MADYTAGVDYTNNAEYIRRNNQIEADNREEARLLNYKNLSDILKTQWTQWLDPKIWDNLGFINDQAWLYDEVFSRNNKNKESMELFKEQFGKANLNYKWDNLSSALPKMNEEFNKSWSDILNKIEALWDIYWDEKAWFFEKIQWDADSLRAWIIWESQEKQALAEWLGTRRWMWTKAMENITSTAIKNQEKAQIWEVDKSETAQLKETANLYNQMLSNLIAQYKATKDVYVLQKIQNAVNVLNLLQGYWSNIAGWDPADLIYN